MASAAMDVSQQRSDSNIASKSTRLCGHFIEDNRSSDMTCDARVKCNHFSIRGYVAEVRKRDPNFCDPFSPYVSHELPHLVLKFRWCQCDSCSSEAGSSKWTVEEARKPVDEANADIPLTNQKSEVDVPNEQNTEASTSTDSNDNRNDTPSSTVCADLKGKGKLHAEDEPIPYTGVCRSLCTKNGNRDMESHQMNHTTDTIEIGPSREHLTHRNGNLINEKASEVAPNAGAVTKGIMETQVAGIVDGPGDNGKVRTVTLPDLNDFNMEPLDDNENEPLVTRNRDLSEDDDDYLGAERRKIPKVRLLSELLGLKENRNNAKLKKKPSSFSTFNGTPALKSSGTGSPGLSSMNENAKRKRTGSHDDDSRSAEMKGSNDGAKKLRSENEASEHDLENDESTEIISKVWTKRRRSTLEKIPLLGKKRKKIKSNHGDPPSMSRHKTISKSNQEKGKPSYADIPPKNDSSARVDDSNLLLNKGKEKMIQSGKEKTLLPLRKSHLLKDGKAGKDKEEKQNVSEHILNEQRQDGSTQGKGTYLSPDRILTTGDDHMCSYPGKEGMHPHSSQVDGSILNEDVIKHSEKRSAVDLPTAPFFMGSQNDACKERSNGPNSNSKGRPIGIPEISERGSVHHTPKQVSNSSTNTKEPTNEARGRMQDIDINSVPTDDEVSKQNNEDDNQDIPMDIVELMAKNQYERNLVDPKDNGDLVTVGSTSNYGKTTRLNGSDSSAYGDNRSKLEQLCSLSLQNLTTTNSRNMVNGFEDKGSSTSNLMNPLSNLSQNHVGIRGHVKENQVSAMSLPSSQEHECVSAFSTFDSTPNISNQHMTTQRYPPSNFFPPAESYNRHRASSSRPNIDARVWPTGVASRMPSGITYPEMIPQNSKSVNKGRIYHQDPSSRNFSNTSPGKQNINFSNGYNNRPVERSSSGASVRLLSKQRASEYPPKTTGSVDLYSNDRIPAMLSLMQNVANIQPAVPLSHDHQYKQHQNTSLMKVGTSGSRQPLNNGRSPMQERYSHPCHPVLPHGRSCAAPFLNDGCYRRNVRFIGPIPLTSQGQRNIENSRFIPQRADHQSQKSLPCDVSRKQATGKGTGATRISSPLLGSRDSSNFLFGVAVKRDEKARNRSSNKLICVVNRNPSEFNDMRELRKYSIRPEDLRPGGPIRAKPSRPKGNGRKLANKPMPILSGKDHGHQKKP